MKTKVFSLCIFLLMAFFATPRVARADVAPPEQPPGWNVEPGAEFTEVRMVAETVVLDVQAGSFENGLGQAKVSADFTMRNLGTESESMAVRFPLGTDDGFGRINEIRSLTVHVNGAPVNTRRIMQSDPVWGSALVPWAEFDVTFPPNEDVDIQVTYIVYGTGEYPFVSYRYVFHTGAGWKDSIGNADLIVRLPYDANMQNVIFEDTTGWSLTTPESVIDGREIRWRFENFEPELGNDFEISLVAPSVWQKVLNEQSNVNRNPNDGEAWGRLGKLYKEILFFRRDFRHGAGGAEIYSLSVASYEKCLSLLPGDGLWHAGFADLLAVHSYYSVQEGEDVNAEKLRSMQEIHLAQQLSPDDQKVKDIAETVYYLFPEAIEQLESGYDYLWLTATPELSTPTLALEQATFTPPATEPPRSTATTVPAEEATSTPQPESPGNPLCASAFILPLGLFWLARSKKILHR